MCVEPSPDGARLLLLVVPGASRDQIVGAHGDVLRVKVTAPPEKGRANAAVIALLARTLGLRVSDIEISAGHGARRKTAIIRGLAADVVRSRLGV